MHQCNSCALGIVLAAALNNMVAHATRAPWPQGGLRYYYRMGGAMRQWLVSTAEGYKARPAVSPFQLAQVPLLYCKLHALPFAKVGLLIAPPLHADCMLTHGCDKALACLACTCPAI